MDPTHQKLVSNCKLHKTDTFAAPGFMDCLQEQFKANSPGPAGTSLNRRVLPVLALNEMTANGPNVAELLTIVKEETGTFFRLMFFLIEEFQACSNVLVAPSKSKRYNQMKKFDDSFEPRLVFFRKGVPLLYEGPLNEEVILETFMQNKEPVAQELTDENFEHLTQASTGATTGDWFVLFYRPDNDVSQRLMARWEALGASLKNRVNVAKVNVQGPGVSTANRLGVVDVPSFVFIRQGKMYRFDLPKHDLSMFVDFANGWYRNVPSKSVPVPPSPFDELVDRVVFFIKENLLLVQVGSGVLVALILALIALSCRSKKSSRSKSPKDKDRKMKKKA
nr:EOG090X0856 [Lepidurus arcticus]